ARPRAGRAPLGTAACGARPGSDPGGFLMARPPGGQDLARPPAGSSTHGRQAGASRRGARPAPPGPSGRAPIPRPRRNCGPCYAAMMLRYLSAGESHGPSLTVILDGVPAGLELVASEHIDPWLRRRQGGYGRGQRMVIETDSAAILGGVRAGRTTGAPVAISIANRDNANWREVMDPAPGNEPRKRALTEPRPGHADLAGGVKYGHKELRDVPERASAREPARHGAAGAVALRLLDVTGIVGCARVVSLGGVPCDGGMDWDRVSELDASPLRTFDRDAEDAIMARIDAAKERGDTLGGVVEARFRGVPVGLGSYVQWDRKLDGRLAQAVMSVPAMKACEIGDGWHAAAVPGSEVHDAIVA